MKIKMNAQEFKRIIENTKRFVCVGGSNVPMQWIYLQIDAENKEIKATAIDGHRMSVEYAILDEVDESFNAFIKPVIPKIYKSDDYAELEVNDNRLYARVGESIIGYVQPEGEFVKYEKILESSTNAEKKITIGVNAKYLEDAMKSINNGDGSTQIVKIDLSDPKSPIIMRSGRRGQRENIKFVLPVNLRNDD